MASRMLRRKRKVFSMNLPLRKKMMAASRPLSTNLKIKKSNRQ